MPNDLPELARAKYKLLDRDGLLHFEYDTANLRTSPGDAAQAMDRAAQLLCRRLSATSAALTSSIRRRACCCSACKAAANVSRRSRPPAVSGAAAPARFRHAVQQVSRRNRANLREALKSAEQIAPCVCGSTRSRRARDVVGGDDGVSRRVLGYLLTWMAERTAPRFPRRHRERCAGLPAELLRKGRFDESSSSICPTRKRAPKFSDCISPARPRIDRLRTSLRSPRPDDGFSGAEIEQVVVSALYAAAAEKIAPTQQHLLAKSAARGRCRC